ncbi:MAG: porin family protein [Calditrichaeota bacterium]|nr:porin family protein [Calditrichota bacterium]
MARKLFVALVVWCVAGSAAAQSLAPPGWLTLEAGGFRLEGDQRAPDFGPHAAFGLGYNVTPYFSIFLRTGAGFAGGQNPNVKAWQRTLYAPVRMEFRINFLPLGRINPFVSASGGFFYWDARDAEGNTISLGESGSAQKGMNSFVGTGAGISLRLGARSSLDIGFRYDYTFTDRLDVRPTGNENDQPITGFVGFSFRFGQNFVDDPDDDGVPNSFDLAPTVPEDPDGYLDHDGKPEPGPGDLSVFDESVPVSQDTVAPIVIHHPPHVVESGHTVHLAADVYENSQLKVVALIYRRIGLKKWEVKRMRPVSGRLYEDTIPGFDLVVPGVEYSIVAVDQALSGVGYSGLPNRPNVIRVIEHGPTWRFLGGVFGTIGMGTVGYLLWHKQQP